MKIKRVYLEITNACNLDCPFCTNIKGQSFMSLDTIKEYLKQIKQVSDYVYLHVLGEPLLHKDLSKILEYTDELNLNVQLVTNGTLLANNLNIFNHKSLRKLSISLHSISDSNINNSYFENIKNIININTSTYIELRFYDLNNLSSDLKDFKEYLYTQYKVIDTPKKNSFKIKDNVYIYYADLFDWPSINNDFISNNGNCHGGIDQIAILNNGKVTICCLDPNGYNEIGDLKKNSLIEILSSNIYQTVINNFRNRKLTFELCKRCSYRLRFDDKHNLKQ